MTKPTGTQTIERSQLRAFFAPYAEQGNRARERLYIHMALSQDVGKPNCEWYHHRAGYVCEVRDDAVCKYGGGGSVDWLSFDTINRITVHTFPRTEALREYLVVDGDNDSARAAESYSVEGMV